MTKQIFSPSDLNNTPHLKIADRLDLFKVLVWLTLISTLFACFMSFYKKSVYADFLLNYIWIFSFAAIIWCLFKKVYLQRKLYLAAMCLILWLILTYWLKDDLLITDPTNRTFLISKCILCGIILPFSYIMDDRDNRRHLDSFLSIVVIVTAALLWISYIGVLRGENISFFDGRFVFGATYTYTDRMMLQFFNLYYYKTGYLALMCFFTTLYLAVSHWSRYKSIIYVFLMLTFTVAVIITYSRTAVFTFLIGLLIAFYIMLQQLPIKTSTRRIIILVSTIGGTIFAAIGLNFTYKFFNSIRDIWYGISTLSSRTDIWASIQGMVSEYPQSLIYGLPIRESMDIMNSFIELTDRVSNMHSGYLQTLVLIGIPGLAAVIAFCIYLLTASGKILFDTSSIGRQSAAIKLMIIVPICFMIMNLVESLIFFNPVQTDIFNLITILFSGYVIEYSHNKK